MRKGIELQKSNKDLPQDRPKSGRISARTQSSTLSNIIKSARVLIVAPLITGASQASTLISIGQYSSALKCAAISGAATMILVSSLALADLIVDFIERKQVSRSYKQK